MSTGPKQSRGMSLAESVINIVVGLGVAMAANAVILPLVGLPLTFGQNMMIAIPMTIVSIARSFALRRLFEALHIRHPISPFVLAVMAERRRQIDVEGWTNEHDDQHPPGELARAGATYLINVATYERDNDAGDALKLVDVLWPWSRDWLKPAGIRRDLVKGCALAVAEGEKYDRARGRNGRAG